MAPQRLTENELRIAVEGCDVATLGRAQSRGQDIRPLNQRRFATPEVESFIDRDVDAQFVEFDARLIELMIAAGAKPLL